MQPQLCSERLHLRAVCSIEHIRQFRGERLHGLAEMGYRACHVLGEPARTQEPRCRTYDQLVSLEQHIALHTILHLIFECLDHFPKRLEVEDLACEEISPDNLRRTGAGYLGEVMDESAAHAVEHAISDIGGDDLAAQRVTWEVTGVAVTQRLRKVPFERGPHPGIVRQRRVKQFFEE